MNERMKIMVAYDGSAYADAALDDLRRAGLPREAEAAIEKGEPQRILIEEARKWDADCIFVGSRGLDYPDERPGLGVVQGS